MERIYEFLANRSRKSEQGGLENSDWLTHEEIIMNLE